MRISPSRYQVDRRELLNGRWADNGGVVPDSVEIASVLVHAKPERLDAVAQAIEALPGIEIHARDANGKLVVVIEAADVGGVGVILNTISCLPNVLMAALVFQGSDSA